MEIGSALVALPFAEAVVRSILLGALVEAASRPFAVIAAPKVQRSEEWDSPQDWGMDLLPVVIG